MADKTYRDRELGHKDKLIDMGDGETHSRRVVVVPPPGGAATPHTVRLSDEDRALLAAAREGYTTVVGQYTPGTARASSRGFLALISAAGSVTLTFDGQDLPFALEVGPNILPLAITKVTLPQTGAATGTFFAVT